MNAFPASSAPRTRATPDPIAQVLRRHAVRRTPVRRAVLALFMQSSCALSRSEVEQLLEQSFDRITLYRTLRTFEEKGLVHRVVDYCETVRYAASAARQSTAHVHFKCTHCQRLFCLPHIAVPAVEVPAAYRVTASDYLLSGLCDQCQEPGPANRS